MQKANRNTYLNQQLIESNQYNSHYIHICKGFQNQHISNLSNKHFSSFYIHLPLYQSALKMFVRLQRPCRQRSHLLLRLQHWQLAENRIHCRVSLRSRMIKHLVEQRQKRIKRQISRNRKVRKPEMRNEYSHLFINGFKASNSSINCNISIKVVRNKSGKIIKLNNNI